jgi:hypothetical protein
MRIGEALSIKLGDLNLESSPATISIKAEYSKSRTNRAGYASDEAKEALVEIGRNAPKDRLVFDYSGDLWQREKVAVTVFRKIAARSGLNDMIENHRTHKIHFHSFRKFFLTKAVDTLGDHAGHALCGHGFYMDTYYRKSEEERKAEYLKLMPRLSVFGREGVSKDEIVATFNRQFLKLSRYTDEEIDTLGDLTQLSPEQLTELQDKKKMQSLGLGNHNSQKVVSMLEIKTWVGSGWEYVTALPDNEAIIRLPTR